MVQFKSIIFIAVIGLAIIVSGCINSNEPTKKSQAIKIINLDPSQLVLTAEDTNEVLGNGFNKPLPLLSDASVVKEFISIYSNKPSGGFIIGVERYPDIKAGESVANIKISVYFDINQTLMNYDGLSSGRLNNGNNIAIGDKGWIYSNDNYATIVFIKNNILIEIQTINLKIEKTTELAKKQDEKISRILEMIK